MSNQLDIDSLDQKIRKVSQSSKKAPAEFLEAELRRKLNQEIVVYNKYEKEFSSLGEDSFEYLKDTLENDYQCYFEPKKFIKELKPAFWWKFTYAGCNSQIEFFLADNGLGTFHDDLWSSGLNKGIKKVEKADYFNNLENLKRYLIGIGYFIPNEKGEIKIHPNLFFGQLAGRTTYATMDSPFLTRDLIRCPYHEIIGYRDEQLSDLELWDYWKDLLALSMARLPEYIYYRSDNFRKKENYKMDIIAPHLELGRKFVPQRYIELESEIEKFEWYIPKNPEITL